MERRATLIASLVTIAILRISPAAFAHVGSPNVFYEGDAGPYHLFVTVNVPQVIPGVADIQIRVNSDEVSRISTTVARLTGPGSNYLPTPDLAARSTTDPRLFTSSLWLMEYGSLRVLLKVNGARGSAEMSVPVASFARSVRPMPSWLGAILLTLATGLALGAISIVGAAAGQAVAPPGEPLPARARRRQFIAMGVTAVVVAAIFYSAFAWWDADARRYAAITTLFRAPKLSARLVDSNKLVISPAEKLWLRYEKVSELVPDHGHLMHLFLIRAPALDRMWHLHPTRTDSGEFDENLPAMDAGHYRIFADVVDKEGFPWTFVGAIDLPRISGSPPAGDNSDATAASISASEDATAVRLEDGTRVAWERGPIKANVPMILKFEVKDRSGAPAADLEPYMGMAAHAEIVASDLSVFAHIHPSGSVPMASLMMVSQGGGNGAPASAAMPGMVMPEQRIPPQISLPYGFPKPGRYRIFLQFKRRGKIETAVFDTRVG